MRTTLTRHSSPPHVIYPRSIIALFRVDRRPYLYFARINNPYPLDFDLLRVRLQFDK